MPPLGSSLMHGAISMAVVLRRTLHTPRRVGDVVGGLK
jgi:hypothetical protein